MPDSFNWNLFEAMPIIGIMRNFPEERLDPVVEQLEKAGIINLEITLNSINPLPLITRLREKWSDKMNIGAGTVCSVDQLHQAIEAGAQFIVAPIVNEEVIRAAKAANVPIFPGAFTPTEIYNAWEYGASMIKVFPATKLGPGFFKDVLEPLNHIKLMPTGGVNLENFVDFLKAGAKGAGIASSLFPMELINNARWDELGDYYRQFTTKYNQFKSEKN